MQTITAQQFQQKYGDQAYNQFGQSSQPTQPDKSVGFAGTKFLGEALGTLSEAKPLVQAAKEADFQKQQLDQKFAQGKISQQRYNQEIEMAKGSQPNFNNSIPARTQGDVIRGGIKAGLDIGTLAIAPGGAEGLVEDTVGGLIKHGAVQGTKYGLAGGAMSGLGQGIEENTGVGNTIKQTLKGGAMGALSGAVTGAAIPAAFNAKQLAEETGQKISQASENVSEKLSGVGSRIKDMVSPITQEASRIPDRIGINIQDKKLAQEAIDQLPSKVARQAAQDGLDMGDIKTIYGISKDQKAPLKKLSEAVKNFAEGKSKTNPIEVVGEPIAKRLKELEGERVKVGAQLGEESKNLGVVTSKETVPAVMNRLQKVPGLEGLTIDDNGMLNFKNTVLTTSETASDRKAIQNAFSSATKWGNGERKHLLRQELFEVLGGKKRAQLNLTDTQERSLEAIRGGLSDVLETKNPQYKALSNRYRKIVTPLKDMRRIMKISGSGPEEDILNMKGGILARRLTSAAPSNPEIKSILNSLDKATVIKGKTRLSTETLQDFYNILEKYYDIAPKTGFQSQVRQGVEKAVGGPMNYIADKLKSYAGETPAVRQKALERILEEVFK